MCSLCESSNETFTERELRRKVTALLPTVTPNMSEVFGANVTCAVVTGSPTLHKYKYGQYIDNFPVVMRFNLHGTDPHSSYGSKTTHRLVNVEISRKKIGFISNVSEIVISKYLYSLKNVLKFYLARKQNLNRSNMLTSTFMGIAKFDGIRYPTTGFMGLKLLSKAYISLYAFGFVIPKDEYVDPNHNYDAEHEVLQKWSQDPNGQVQLTLHPPLR